MSSRASRVALVTGASSGFGLHIARRLAADGFRTFGTSRSERPDAGAVSMRVLNVRDAASVQACVGAIEAEAGRIDVLINNAGVLDVGPAEEHGVEGVRAVFETNVLGTVRTTLAALPGMRARRSGRIVTIGSLASHIAPPGEAAYAASKFAVAGYFEALGYEVAPFGIAVSVVDPGFFQTGIGASVPPVRGAIADYDDFRAAIRAAVADNLDRGGDPADVGAVVSRVVAARRPRARYRVGTDAVWLPRLRRLLPERAFAWGVRREFGL